MKATVSAWLGVVSLASSYLGSPAAAQDRETRALTGFEAIRVGGGIDLFVRQGEPFLVEVEATEGDAADVVTEVRNGALLIHHDRSFFDFFDWRRDEVTVYVTLPTLVS